MKDAQLCKALLGRRKLIHLDNLGTDPNYQRPPDRSKVEALRGRATRPIFVNRRSDGTLWIIDGQHRALAARARGRRIISAHVVSVPQADEPLLYAALNGQGASDVIDDDSTSIVKGP